MPRFDDCGPIDPDPTAELYAAEYRNWLAEFRRIGFEIRPTFGANGAVIMPRHVVTMSWHDCGVTPADAAASWFADPCRKLNT